MAAVVTIFLPMITSTDVLWFAYLLLGTGLGLINIGMYNIAFSSHMYIEGALLPEVKYEVSDSWNSTAK